MSENQVLLLLFDLQFAYSYLSTNRVNEAIGDNTLKYVYTCAASDLVKYAITAGLALQAVNGQFLVILTTVLGGAIGNYLAHWKMNNHE